MQRFSHLLFLLFLSCFFTLQQDCRAQGAKEIQLAVSASMQGSAVYPQGAAVRIFDEFADPLYDFPLYESYIDENGYANFYFLAGEIPYATYQIQVSPLTSGVPTYPEMALYQPALFDLEISPSNINDCLDSVMLDCFTSVTLSSYTRFIEIIVQDSANTKINDAYLYIDAQYDCPFEEKRILIDLISDANGAVKFGIANQDNCTYVVSVNDTLYGNSPYNGEIYPSFPNGSTLYQEYITLQGVNGYINVALKNSDGSDYQIAANEEAFVNCSETNASGNQVSESLYQSSGTNIASIAAPNGTYNCYVDFYVEAIWDSSRSVSIVPQEVVVQDSTVEVQATITTHNESVRVRIIDPDIPSQTYQLKTSSPKQSAYIDCFSTDETSNASGYVSLKAGDPAEGNISLPPGDYVCNAWIDRYNVTGDYWEPDSSFSFNSKSVTLSQGDSGLPVDFTPQTANATLTIKLVDRDNNLFTHDGFDANVSCSSTDGSFYTYDTIPSGVSSFPISVVDGITYDCWVDFWSADTVGSPPFPGGEGSAPVTGGTGTIPIPIRTFDGKLKVEVVDTNGVVIPGIYLSYDVYSEPDFNDPNPTFFSGWGENDQGAYTFDVPTGLKLSAGINEFFPAATDETTFAASQILSHEEATKSTYSVRSTNGNNYFIPFTRKTITISEGDTGTKVVRFTLEKQETFLDVSVFKADGVTRVEYGWVSAASYDFDADPADTEIDFEDEHWTGAEIIDGEARIGVRPGREYEVFASVDFDTGGQEIPPAPQFIEPLTTGETRKLTFKSDVPNHTVNVTIIEPSESASAQNTVKYLNCYAEREGGNAPIYVSNLEGNTATIPLVVSDEEPWLIGCEEITYNPDAVESTVLVGTDYYFPQEGTSQGQLSLSLSEDSFPYHPPTKKRFSANETGKLKGPSGLEVVIPPGAFGENGEIDVTISTPKGLTYFGLSYPLLAFKYSFNKGNNRISKPNSPVTLKYPVDLSKLTKLGVTVNDLAFGYFNEKTRTWVREGSFTYDDKEHTITATVTHFSIWGTIVNKGKALKSSIPSALKASKKNKSIKAKKAPSKVDYVLSWTPPSSAIAAVTQYEVDLRLVKAKKKKKKNKKKKKKKKKKKDKDSDNEDESEEPEEELDEWADAELFSTKENSVTANLIVGNTYDFRVRVKGGKSSFSAGSFKAKAPKLKKKSGKKKKSKKKKKKKN